MATQRTPLPTPTPFALARRSMVFGSSANLGTASSMPGSMLPSVPPRSLTTPSTFAKRQSTPPPLPSNGASPVRSSTPVPITARVVTEAPETPDAPLAAPPARAASSRLRAVRAAWHGVKFVATGFLIGAVAVHAVAIIRMSRRIDTMHADLAQVVAEQTRLSRAATANAGLVFPAMDLAQPLQPTPLQPTQQAEPPAPTAAVSANE